MSTDAPIEVPVAEGDVLAGKYRVERVLGVGGMGVVVAARHIQLEDRVAIKFLLPAIAAAGGEPVARFAREGRAAVKIRSEHVARVTDVGMLDSGSPYMVLEYLEGQDLAQLIDASGALSVEDALDYLLQACEAIAEAHSLGIVHRDLKPANLFLTQRADRSACVKVLDFGISKMSEPTANASDQNMTGTRTLMGSPLYMSPEQLTSSRDVDARTDIWALGVILFELLTAAAPFGGDTMPQLIARILEAKAPPIRARRADVPAELEAIVLRCLERDPAARYANVGELAVALAPLAPQRAQISIERITRVASSPGKAAPSVARRAPTHGASETVTDPTMVTRSVRLPSGGARRILVASGIALVIACAAGIALSRRSSSGPTTSAPITSASPPPSTSAPISAPAASVIAVTPSATAEAIEAPPAVSTAAPLRGVLPRPKPKASAPVPGVVPDDRL